MNFRVLSNYKKFPSIHFTEFSTNFNIACKTVPEKKRHFFHVIMLGDTLLRQIHRFLTLYIFEKWKRLKQAYKEKQQNDRTSLLPD